MFSLSSIPGIYFSISFEQKPVINRNSQTTRVTFTYTAIIPALFSGLDCRATRRIDRRKGRRAFDTLTVTLSQLFPAHAFATLPSLVPSVKSRRLPRLPRLPPCPECIMVHVQSTNGARSFDRDTCRKTRKIEINTHYRQIRIMIELFQLSEKHSKHVCRRREIYFLSNVLRLSQIIYRCIRYLRNYLK